MAETWGIVAWVHRRDEWYVFDVPGIEGADMYVPTRRYAQEIVDYLRRLRIEVNYEGTDLEGTVHPDEEE
jgi:hypothetical protein